MYMQFIVLVHSKGLKVDGTQASNPYPLSHFCLTFSLIYSRCVSHFSSRSIALENMLRKCEAEGGKSSKFINFIPLYFYACEHVTFSIMTSFIIG